MAECGCGRRLTGQCIGWHNISEEEYQQKLKEHQEKVAEEKKKTESSSRGPAVSHYMKRVTNA
jgi:hypothetical protein